jgi:CRP-like cAMP-binding protein
VIDRHLMKLRARDDINRDEETAIRSGVARVRRLSADETLVKAFKAVDVCSILVSGLAARVKDMRDGQRQISELHTPGDFADLHSFTLKYLEHDIVALTDCEFAIVPHTAMKAITERHPHLTRVYWFSTNLDGAVHREWVVSLGRRHAAARMAHLFCELHVRLGLVGLAPDNGYSLPLTQAELAQCLGLSDVHVNRTLMQLRGEGLVEFRGGRLDIKDLAALRELAEFDDSYLYLDRRPR